MAKVQIKSEKLTPFGGIFSIMEQFGSMISPIIDRTLGQRCRSIIGYQYNEIVRWILSDRFSPWQCQSKLIIAHLAQRNRSLMSVYFCGGSCVEDVTSLWLESAYCLKSHCGVRGMEYRNRQHERFNYHDLRVQALCCHEDCYWRLLADLRDDR